jgi:triacylglycerol lipase
VAPELKSLLKNAQAPVILDNVGHMPILEADQLVVQQYLPFLSKIQHKSLQLHLSLIKNLSLYV